MWTVAGSRSAGYPTPRGPPGKPQRRSSHTSGSCEGPAVALRGERGLPGLGELLRVPRVGYQVSQAQRGWSGLQLTGPGCDLGTQREQLVRGDRREAQPVEEAQQPGRFAV